MSYQPEHDIDVARSIREGKAREDALAHLLLRAAVEVKSDKMCRHTGNLAVEYEQVCRDGVTRKSGLSLTESDWHAFEYDDDKWLFVTTAEVKRLARRAIDEGRHKWVGDNDNHHNALVPLEWFTASSARRLEVAA